MAPGRRPKAMRGQAYGPPSMGKVEPSSALIRPLGMRYRMMMKPTQKSVSPPP